ncbi:MAG: hypothetical protein AUJ20_09900 [Comamonadaceae bacterium CG1_02_60_18]|nr:MAG: hypothetical protein AUJ20_09900 [Comamonadaceae bacterium CG1_02_60_18]
MDHGIGLWQVQARATGFQADQKQGHVTAGELVNQRVVLLALPGELDPLDVALDQFVFDQAETRAIPEQ